MRQDQYTTRLIHPVCINLEPQHFQFLREIALTQFSGDYNQTLYYLLSKYLNYLYEIRITSIKQTETANYQPVTKRYKRWTIYVNPVLWSKLFETRHFVGYSMSALIRIMLDWEMQQLGYDIIPLIPLPVSHETNVQPPEPSHPSETFLHNYFYQKQGNYGSRIIICSFLDEYS